MGNNIYCKGDWDAICDSCGRKYKASELRKRWDGLMVCSQDWEPRQPQDFVRAIVDRQAVPWSRPEATDTFVVIDPDVCTFTGRSAHAGLAVIGCSVIGRDISGYDLTILAPETEELMWDHEAAIVGFGLVGLAQVGRGSSLSPLE